MASRKLGKSWRNVVAAIALAGSTASLAGPVVIGGDDLNDHGSYNTVTNANELGWLYIRNALQGLLAGVTRPGNNGRIAVLGSAPSTSTSSDGCGAVYWPGQVLGRQVDCIDTVTGINQFFADLAAGTANPAVIVIPGDGVTNDLDSAEEAALTTHASAIAAFVASGGGLLSHSQGYGWLSALIPTIAIDSSCSVSGATLTPAGASAFPVVTNADIQAGPCHNTFVGPFGGLQVLATDGQGRALVIGGGATTTIAPAVPSEIPTLSEWAMILMAMLVAGSAVVTLRRR